MMKKKLFALIAAGAAFLSAAFAGAGEIVLFGPEILRDAANFTVHQGGFTPAADGKPAVMSHPAGKWSALYRLEKLPALPAGAAPEFVFTVKAKTLGNAADLKATMLFTYFYDKAGKQIKVEKPGQAFIKWNAEPQSWEVVGAIPEGTEKIRAEINSHGAFDLEISEFKLALRSPELSSAGVLGIERLGRSSLENTAFWHPYDAQFTPAVGDVPAKLTFPAGKWSALIGTAGLDPKFSGSVVVKAACRWSGDFREAKFTSLSVQFLNGDRKVIKAPASAANQGVFRKSGDWQEFLLDAPVPEGAVAVRIDFSSHGGGTIEIRDVEVRFKGVGLTEAAVKGIELPGVVPAGRKAAAARPDCAEVECFAEVPFDLAAPFWGERPEYEIPATKQNKSPLQKGDSRAAFRLAADREFLYVFFRASDDVLNFRSEVLYERDAFEFFLMPTGKFRNARSRIRQEQYTVTRDAAGATVVKNVAARSRLVDGGWEALMKIPLGTETRRITPFNGLELSFNAAYQDADQLPQEHWLSFSALDQTGESWSTPALYAPLTFVSQLALPYRPLWLGDAAEYHVAPNHPGRINLIEFPETMANLGFWGEQPEAAVTGDGERFQVKYPVWPTAAVRVLLPVFQVLPGEELEFEYEGRISSGSVPAPQGNFLAQTNWEQISFGRSSRARELTPEWTKISFRTKVPEKFRDNLRSGRLLMDWGSHPGRTLEMRNFRLTRRLPADFDARIAVDGPYSHLRAGEPNRVEFFFDTPVARKVKLSAVAKPYFGGANAAELEQELELPAGRGSLAWPLDQLPAGFFNIQLKVRAMDGGFLADRELFVAKYLPADVMNPQSGIWFHNAVDLTPPRDDRALVGELRKLGSGVVYFGDLDFFDPRGGVAEPNPAVLVMKFKEAGFKVGSLLPRGNRLARNGRIAQPAELPEFFRHNLELAGGAVDYWNFSNEANLEGGWAPSADAREWVSFYRPFYSAVRQQAPGAVAVLGNLNRMPVDFMREFHRQNGTAFADGVIGVHLYGYEYNGNGFETLLAARREYEKLYPGWKVWDMESGSVFHSFGMLSEMLAKKMPMHLTAGVEMSIFYNDRDLLLPHADATPLVPIEAFKNRFYLNAEPVGRVTLADGAVHVYLFRRPDGSGAAALWNTTASPVTCSLPGGAGAERFDQFGNRLGSAAELKLDNRFVNYFEKIDLAQLAALPDFIAAFRSPEHAARQPAAGTAQETYVVPATVTRNFDHRLAAGQPLGIGLVFRNDGKGDVAVTPSGAAPEGVGVRFEPSQFHLAPGAVRQVAMTITADKFAAGELEVGGTLGDGRKLVPTVFHIEPAPPVSVEGDSRSITVRNNSAEMTDIELAPSCRRYFFTPDVIRLSAVKPGESRVVPLVISRKNADSRYANRPEFYTIRVKYHGGEFDVDGTLIAFQPKPLSGAVDFARLERSVEQGGLKVDYQLFEAPGALRLVARIHDATPVQTRENGDIRTGGDLLLAVFEDGKSYREYGFAVNGGKRYGYFWDGRYGVETARDAADRINHLVRSPEFIDLDVTLPLDGAKPGDGFSIRVVDRDGDGRERVVDLGGGIIPRNPGKMGALIR